MFYKLCAKCGAVIPLGETYCDKCRPVEKVTREELQVDDSEEMSAKVKSFYKSSSGGCSARASLRGTSICALPARQTVACRWPLMCIISSVLNRTGTSDLIRPTAYLCARSVTTKRTRPALFRPGGICKKLRENERTERRPTSSQQKRRK